MQEQSKSGVILDDMDTSKAKVHAGLNLFAYCLVLYYLLVVYFLPSAFASPLKSLTLGMPELTLAVMFLVIDRLYTRRPFYIRSMIWWLLIGFALTIYISAFGPDVIDRNLSMVEVKKLLGFRIIPCFLILNTVHNWKRLKVLLWLLVLTAFFATVFSLWQFATADASVFSWRLGGAGGGIAHTNPNFFCMALLVVMPLSCYFYITAKNTYLKYGCITICSVFVMALLLSGSRSGLLGLAVICIGAIWRWKRRFLTIMAVTIIFAFVIGLSHPAFRYRVASIAPKIEPTRQSQEMKSETLIESDDLSKIILPGGLIIREARIGTWKVGLDIFLDHPIFGIGRKNFARAHGERVAPARTRAPHNSILLVFFEAGILGGTMFLVLLGVVIRKLRRLAKEPIGGVGKVNASVLAGALELGLYGFFVSGMFHDQTYYIWLYLLIIFAAIVQRFSKGEGNS